MGSGFPITMAKNVPPENNDAEQEHPHSLVPTYLPFDAVRGIRAYRRGPTIVYTVRGEPDEVLALIGELKGRGVREIGALVFHHSDDQEPEEPPAADAEVLPGPDDE
ncbi:MAG: hypothetical protein QGH74_04020 [Candidatus Brocadiia bacterium]|jgi:hypothetical protein|nr:hypothetical protein [Candidatus Brocadiia bacterium]